MVRLFFDFETSGLFADDIRPGTKNPTIIDRVHCLVTQDIDTGEVRRYFDGHDDWVQPGDEDLAVGVARVLAADVRCGHNSLNYDERVIREFYPSQWAARRKDALVLDSMVGAKVGWPTEHIRRLDMARIAKARAMRRPEFPGQLCGKHSLEAWGCRIGNRKAKYEGGFATFTRAMLDYCVQDVSTGVTLFKKIEAKVPLKAWLLEQDYAPEIKQQMANGFLFDAPAAERLTARLQGERAQILADLAAAVPPFRNVRYTKVKKLERVETVAFNPGSRHHVARHLKERHGWEPTAFTEGGDVQVDETVLESVAHLPDVPKIQRYFVVNKVLGMLAEPKKKDSVPWMKMVREDGRIHGYVDHNGAVTSRCTHSKPNMTQVPKVGNPFGEECRSLFVAGPGMSLVGIDASGLELRMLAHWLAPLDGGEYVRAVVEGDVHTKNQHALGIPDGPTARDTSKRAVYAELYGAGNEKLGKTIDPSGTAAEHVARGKRAKRLLLNNVKGLRALKDRCALLHEKVGSVNLPDGRRAPTRADYSAVNTLLQASGAVVMKLAVVLFHRECRIQRLSVKQAHQAHDEIQVECPTGQAAAVEQIGRWAFVQAGVDLGIRCPLKADSHVGKNWAETH